MTSPKTRDADAFIHAHTAAGAPPLVPEISLRLAGDVLPLWEGTQSLGVISPRDLPPPYWAFAWPGGQALARFLLDHPEKVAGKRVLDFGSGSGLVAIAAAKAGAAHVDASDIDPLAAAVMRLNAEANGVRLGIVEDDVIGLATRWDTVVAADLWYERPLAERLTRWLRDLARAGANVLLADPGRHYFPEGGVLRLANYVVPTSRDLEDRDSRETSVYRLLP